MTSGNDGGIKVTGNQMPQKRDRKPSSIFVVAGKSAVKEFKDIPAAEKAMTGTDFVVIRGQRLEKKISVKYL